MIKYNLGKLSHFVTEQGTSNKNLLLILGCWTSHGENKCQATTVYCRLLIYQRVLRIGDHSVWHTFLKLSWVAEHIESLLHLRRQINYYYLE